MLTGELRSQVDSIWNAFWSGGISNPLEVMEQITYLLFLRRLDDLHTLEENKAVRLNKPIERRIFPEGKDAKGRDFNELRWSRFKNQAPSEMFQVIDEHVFPFLRTMGSDGSTYSHHMKDARFTIPTPALLAKVVDMLDHIPMEDRDTKGDLYEYMLSKIASAGQNGQFRTPRHIIQLMVELTAPTPTDVICDPASGTCGYLVAAGEYLRENHPEIFRDAAAREHFHHKMFHGYDFDNTMLRIGSMNMALHGVDNPDIRYRDSLSQEYGVEEDKYSLILANPPFAGSLDYENTAKDLLTIVKTKKTELLFLALFLRLLKPGGRAAVIVPDGVLFGSSKAHKELRQMVVEEQKLDAVISLPSGVFKPYAGVSTAILVFTKTNSGGTDNVWFYDMQADGRSLDDKRQPLLSEDKLGAVPATPLTDADHAKNNLPDVLVRWKQREVDELKRPRTAQSFCVPKREIAANGYALSINRYKVIIREAAEQLSPEIILGNLTKIGEHASREIANLGKMVKSIQDFEGKNQFKISTLGSLANLKRGPFGGALKKEIFTEKGYMVYEQRNAISNDCMTGRYFISESKYREMEDFSVKPGDILVSCSGTIGRVVIVPENAPKGIINQALLRIRVNTEKVTPEYVKIIFESTLIQNKLNGISHGTGLKNFPPMSEVKSLQLPIPSLDLQFEIAHC